MAVRAIQIQLLALKSKQLIEADCIGTKPFADVLDAVGMEDVEDHGPDVGRNARLVANAAGVFAEGYISYVVGSVLDGVEICWDLTRRFHRKVTQAMISPSALRVWVKQVFWSFCFWLRPN